jgi:serine O-acetyltransferase
MFYALERDYRRYSKNTKGSVLKYIYKFGSNAGFRAMCFYRLGVFFKKRKLYFFAGMCQRFMHHLCHCWISVSAKIGPGFLIAHVGGIIIGGLTEIGTNCDIRQNVTFGGNFNKTNSAGRSQPLVGNNVSFGAGAVILGPVKIGNNALIGANSVVTRDIAPNMIAFGIPAKEIKKRWDENSSRKL